MRILRNAQRSGILQRLKHNNKYAVAVSYAPTFPEKDALEFASVLREAGWTVSGPFVNENICGEGPQIGVPDLHCPCPGAPADGRAGSGRLERAFTEDAAGPSVHYSKHLLAAGRPRAGGALRQPISGMPEAWDMIASPVQDENTAHQDLYSDLIRLHILHHACTGEIFGLWMIEELGRHGYKLSPGTMYPLLHSLEERGLLVSREKREGRRYRRLYRATPAGSKALVVAKQKVRELFGELFEHKHSRGHSKAKSRR